MLSLRGLLLEASSPESPAADDVALCTVIEDPADVADTAEPVVLSELPADTEVAGVAAVATFELELLSADVTDKGRDGALGMTGS